MEVEVLKYPTEEDWKGVKLRSLVTIGKKLVNPPDMEWKVKMLRCRHSPIRYLTFAFFLKNIPYWLSTELCRHHSGCEKFVKSQRDDRAISDIPRSEKTQGSLVNMIFDVNAEALCVIMNKRLCGAATKEMQQLMLMIRKEVLKTNPEFENFLVPMCKLLHGCNEFTCCNKQALYFKEGEN